MGDEDVDVCMELQDCGDTGGGGDSPQESPKVPEVLRQTHRTIRITLHVPQARDMQALNEPFVIRATLRQEALVSKVYPPAAAITVNMVYEWEFIGPWEEISTSSINLELIASDSGAQITAESLPLTSATAGDAASPTWLNLPTPSACGLEPPSLLVELIAESPGTAVLLRIPSTLSSTEKEKERSVSQPDSPIKCGSSEDISRESTLLPHDSSIASAMRERGNDVSARIVLRLVRGRALNALETAFVLKASLKGEAHCSRPFEPAPLIKLALCMEWQMVEPWKTLQKSHISLEVLKVDSNKQLAHQNLLLRQGRLTTVGSAFWRDLSCSWLRPGQERPAILIDLQVELPSTEQSHATPLMPMMSTDMLSSHQVDMDHKHRVMEMPGPLEHLEEESSSGERSGAEESSELEGASGGGGSGPAAGSGVSLVVVEVVRGRALSGLQLPIIMRATLRKYPLHALIFNSARFPRIDAYFEWRRCEPWSELRRSRVHLELLTTDGLKRIGCLPGSLSLADAPLFGARAPVWCKLMCPSLPQSQAQPSLLLSVSVALPPSARSPSPSPFPGNAAPAQQTPCSPAMSQGRGAVRVREHSTSPSSDSPRRHALPLPPPRPPGSRPHSRRTPASPQPPSRPRTKSSRTSRTSRVSRRDRQCTGRVASAAATRRRATTSSASASSPLGPSEGEGAGSGGDGPSALRSPASRPTTRAPPTATQAVMLRRPPPRTPSSAEFFSLRLHCGSVSNLDLLDRENYQQPEKPFTLSFTWMGRSLNACSFESLSRYQAKVEGIWLLLRGPLSKIREFMHYVEMIRLRLHRGEEELAYTFVDVRTLCNDSSSKERRRERGRHFLVDSQTKEIPEGAGRVRPTVDVSVTIEPAELAPEQLRAAHLHLRSMQMSGACDFFMPYPRSSSASSSDEWSYPPLPPPTRDSTLSKTHSRRPKIFVLPYSVSRSERERRKPANKCLRCHKIIQTPSRSCANYLEHCNMEREE